MMRSSPEELGSVKFDSDSAKRERIIQQAQEIFDAYKQDPRWRKIDDAIENQSDRKLGGLFGAHIGSHYALKYDGKPIRLLIIGKDSYEDNHHGVHLPSEFMENEQPGRGLKKPRDLNWGGVQSAVWKVLQKGAEFPANLPYFIEVDGKTVPWLSCAAYTNRYQRAVVHVDQGHKRKRSLAENNPTRDRIANRLFQNISSEAFNAILSALNPTHIVFNGINGPAMLFPARRSFRI